MEENYNDIRIDDMLKKKKDEGKKNSYLAIVTPLLIGVFSAVSYYIGSGNLRTKDNKEKEEQIYKINHVLNAIEGSYVDSVNREDLIDRSIESMLTELDPHSSYIPAKDVERENEQLLGHFGGVGIRFIILRDTLMITNIIHGGPSEIAGLKQGDRVIKVDGENIAGTGLQIEGVHDRLKGEAGSKVDLEIIRKGVDEPKNITISRGLIPLPSIDAAFMLDENIGYIRIKSFSDKTGEEFAYQLKKLKKEGLSKLILDLRNNGGGYMHGATSVADEFLKAGTLIVYTEGVHQRREDRYATSYGNFEQNDLVVLVNSATASASEIVSGAIQDNDRGIIMGRRTFGKGLVQMPMDLEDGSELRLTVSRYYTPTGRCIQKPYGNGIDYYNDIMNRYETGQLQEIDSASFETAEKFTTPGGRTVYGGGGIMPDIFVPIDTSGSSLYLTTLAYSAAYRDFSFDYVDSHKKDLKYRNVEEFNSQFQINDELFNEFVDYAEKEHGVEKDAYGIRASKKIIIRQLKAEIATYLWGEEARIYVSAPEDNDIHQAILELNK